jgi:tRNA pseudouridine55 synthase
VPPMVSAIKVDGRRLHDAARAGEEVDREPRAVTVHGLELLELSPGERAEAEVEVTCSAGTYVRTLAHDAGRALGVGASLLTLRRTVNGPFTDGEAHSLDEVVSAGERRALAELTLAPLEAVSRCLPVVEVADEGLARRLVQGGGLPAQGHPEPYGVVHAGLLLGVYADEGERARPQLVWTRPEELAAAGHLGEDAPATRDEAPSASTRGQQP